MSTAFPEVEKTVLTTVVMEPEYISHLLSFSERASKINFFTSPDLNLVYRSIVEASAAHGENTSTVLIPAVVDILDKKVAEINKALEDKRGDNNQGKKTGLLAVGAKKYVQQLQLGIPFPSFAEFQSALEMLNNARNLRLMQEELATLQKDIADSSVAVKQEDIESRLQEIAGLAEKDVQLFSSEELIEEALDSKESTWQVSTGIEVVDAFMGGGGFESANVTVVAARAKVGKTTMAMNLLKGALDNGATAIVFSYETKISEFTAKLASVYSVVPWRTIKEYIVKGEDRTVITEDEKRRVKEAFRTIRELPLHTSFDREAKLSDIQASVARVKEQSPPNTPIVLMVDYIGLQVTDESREREQVTALSKAYSILAGKEDIAVLYIAQINRSGAEGPPRTHHIKSSGSIEADADTVFLLDSPSLRGEAEEPYLMRLHAAATRHSSPGVADMYIDHSIQTVMTMEQARELKLGVEGFDDMEDIHIDPIEADSLDFSGFDDDSFGVFEQGESLI